MANQLAARVTYERPVAGYCCQSSVRCARSPHGSLWLDAGTGKIGTVIDSPEPFPVEFEKKGLSLTTPIAPGRQFRVDPEGSEN